MRTIEEVREEMKENDVARSGMRMKYTDTIPAREAYNKLYIVWLQLRAERDQIRAKEMLEEEKRYVYWKYEFTPTFAVGDIVTIDSTKHKQLKPLDKMVLTITGINETRNCCEITCTGKGYLNGMTYTFAFDAIKKVESKEKEDCKEEKFLEPFTFEDKGTATNPIEIGFTQYFAGNALACNGYIGRKIPSRQNKEDTIFGKKIANFFSGDRVGLSIPDKFLKTGQECIIIIRPDKIVYTGVTASGKYCEPCISTHAYIEVAMITGIQKPAAYFYGRIATVQKGFKKPVTISILSDNKLLFSSLSDEGEGFIQPIRYTEDMEKEIYSVIQK